VRVSSWDGRATLVTGAGGFIASHLVAALVGAGARVRGLCRYSSTSSRGALELLEPAVRDAVEVQFGDVRDPDTADRATAGIEVVIHLAALIAVPYSYLSPRDYLETNVLGTVNLAQAARHHGVTRFVHVSSSEVYGEVSHWPIAPDQPLAPRSPYAASKAAADLVLESFRAAFSLPVVLARPFNAYGPHQSARAIVPAIVVQALAGETIELGSLTPRRDLTFVRDTAAGLMAIAAAPALPAAPLHLGTGTDVSVGELVTLISEALGRRLTPVLDPQRIRPPASEVSRLVCDASATAAATGWRTSVALRDGLAETVEWIDAHRDRYREGYAR
jgi:nucleoside-diphosphate-sugar epimerase